mmetsp:Transcript_45847/g.120224  ORF Transcript_45847/g.120224 Transcript_45847/m.120224 type:complete len:291 (+) Transcript_45847:52-924(+)
MLCFVQTVRHNDGGRRISEQDVSIDAVIACMLTLIIHATLSVRHNFFPACMVSVGVLMHLLTDYARSTQLRDVSWLVIYLVYATTIAGGGIVCHYNINVPGGVKSGGLAQTAAAGGGRSQLKGPTLHGQNIIEYLDGGFAWIMAFALALAGAVRLGCPASHWTIRACMCAIPAVAFLGHAQAWQLCNEVAVLTIATTYVVNLYKKISSGRFGLVTGLATLIASGVAIRGCFSIDYYTCLNLIVWSEVTLLVLKQPAHKTGKYAPKSQNWTAMLHEGLDCLREVVEQHLFF